MPYTPSELVESISLLKRLEYPTSALLFNFFNT